MIKYVEDQSLALHWHLRMQMKDAQEDEEKQRRSGGVFLGASIKKIYWFKLNNFFISGGTLSLSHGFTW